MKNPASVLAASSLVAAAIAIVWLHAPPVPVLAGAVGGGLLLYLRARRQLVRSQSR